jgi:Ca-activated chloride channel family protein
MSARNGALTPEDPRLTAHALGELEGAECAEVERLLASDAGARELVEGLRATAKGLEREYRAELAAATRAKPIMAASQLMAAASTMSLPHRIWLHVVGQAVMMSAAAVLIGMSLAGSERGPGPQEESLVAKLDAFVTADSPLPPLPPEPNAPLSSGTSPDSASFVVRSAFTPSTDAGDLATSCEEVNVTTEPGGTAIGVGTAGYRSSLAGGSLAAASARPSAFSARRLGSGGGAMPRREEGPGHDTESYASTGENPFKLATSEPLSTFSIDVDTASYANARRFLEEGRLPPPDAVRVEEFLNYFRYAYPVPQGNAPFSSRVTVASCPWAPAHKLVQIGLRAREIEHAQRPSSNLVFLIDVSGSMNEPLKLPLLVRSMRMLVDQLDERDRVAIVVYAGSSGLVLPSTNCSSKAVIAGALDRLQAGGSTNGGAGIELAYEIAQENFITNGQNRVVLCTDGDFNVGVSSEGALARLIEEKRKSGVFLSVLGFGEGNLKDSTMELLADKGNGNYAYVDSLAEARKVLVAEMGGTLFTVAKDVKIQVEFNPTLARAWRLIGYENRVLAHQDFNDDTKDAGEIGAGHTVTALYEIVPFAGRLDAPGVDPLRYQEPSRTSAAAFTDELLTLKLRYKAPDGDKSLLISTPVQDSNASWQEAGPDFQFAAAVAAFGMVLRQSPNVSGYTLADVQNLATLGVGDDVEGYRREFLELVRKAQAVAR